LFWITIYRRELLFNFFVFLRGFHISLKKNQKIINTKTSLIHQMKKTSNPITNRLEKIDRKFNQAIKFYKSKNYDSAIENLIFCKKNNIQFNPKLNNKKILYYLIRSYSKLKQFKLAKDHLQELIGIKKAKSYSEFEAALEKLNQYQKTKQKDQLEKSINHLNKAKGTKDPDVFYYLGYTSLLNNKPIQAKRYFKKTLEIDQEYKNIHAIKLFNQIKVSQ